MSIHVWFDGPVYCIEGLVYTLSASLSGHKCYFDNRFVPDICCVFKAACIQFAKFTPLSLFSDVTSSRQWLNSTALQTLFYFLLHSQVFHISNDLLKICWEDKVFIKTLSWRQMPRNCLTVKAPTLLAPYVLEQLVCTQLQVQIHRWKM